MYLLIVYFNNRYFNNRYFNNRYFTEFYYISSVIKFIINTFNYNYFYFETDLSFIRWIYFNLFKIKAYS